VKRGWVLGLGLAIVLPLVAVLANGFRHDPREFDSPLVEKAAPDFALTSTDGQPVKLAELRGKPVVVNFWATWCVPCQQEHPYLLAAARKWSDRAHFLGVVYQDTPEKIDAWLAKHGEAYPTLVDEGSRTAIAWGVYGVPETYVIDAGGVIRHKFVGPVDPALLDGWLAKLADEAPASAATASAGSGPAAVVGPPAGPPLEGAALKEKAHAVASKLRCVVCQGLSVADSPSDAARAMRAEVESLVAQGFDEEQVLFYFEASYGEFVLLEPKVEGVNLLVWTAPIGLLAVGLGVIAFLVRRRPAAPAPVAAAGPDDEYLRRVREELKG
jgi:cytochrome c biogenesis protein CcmG/thiol:disulfide interchange protein DsbE